MLCACVSVFQVCMSSCVHVFASVQVLILLRLSVGSTVSSRIAVGKSRLINVNLVDHYLLAIVMVKTFIDRKHLIELRMREMRTFLHI